MLSVKVVVGGGGTSCAVNMMTWPLPSLSIRDLSLTMHRAALKGTGAEVRRPSSDPAWLDGEENGSDSAGSGNIAISGAGNEATWRSRGILNRSVSSLE